MIAANTHSMSTKQNNVGVPPTTPKAHQRASGTAQSLSIEGIKTVIALYGYGLTVQNELISSTGKVLATSIQITRGRLHVMGRGQLLFSGGTAQSIGQFLEKFYFASKTTI